MTMLDETVPFYPIALHGYVRFYGTTYNYMNEPGRDVLRALSWGALPNFDLMYADSADLWGLNNTSVFNSSFYMRRDEFIDVYNRFREAYHLISGKEITAYTEIGNIVEVTYQDTVIYFNMGTEAATHNGITIPGLDFIVHSG